MALKKIMCLILMVVLSVLCIASCDLGTTPNTPEPEKTITKIEYVEGSMDTTISAGDTLNTSGLKIKVIYSDGSTTEVGVNQLTLSRVDTFIAGTKKLTITYEGFRTEVSIEVSAVSAPATPTAITNIKGFPTALSIGDSFSAAATTATVSFSDGTSKSVGIADGLVVDASEVNTAKGGTYYVFVSYDGCTPVPVAVTVSATLVGIELDATSVNTQFFQGDTVNLSAMKVYAVYSDNEKVRINAADLVIDTDAITTDTLGERNFTITYTAGGQDYVITVPYTVVKKPVRIEIDEASVNAKVDLGGTVDTSTIAVKVVYSDETEETLEIADLQIGSISTATAGEKTLTVRYGDLTDSITITVEPVLYGIEYKGEALAFTHRDTADKLAAYIADGYIVIDLIYDNGNENYTRVEKLIASIDEIGYTDFDTAEVTEEAYMNIIYSGFSASVEYSVVKYLASLEISENSTFVSKIGHNDDAAAAIAGLVITAVYSNGETEEIALEDLVIDGFATNVVVADAEMTVSYENEFGSASTTVAYEIYRKFASLEFADESYPTVYKPYDTVSTATEIKATVIYSDGSKEDVIATLDSFVLLTDTIDGVVKELTFSYVDENEETRTGSVTVEVLKVNSLEIIGLDNYIPYWNTEDEIADGYVNTLINAANLSVFATLEDRFGATYEETLASRRVNHSIDIKTPGAYTVSVVCDYGIATADVTVGVELASITVLGATTEYFQGGELNLSNITIIATYHDGSTKEFAYADIADKLTASGFSADEVGEDKEYTVTYAENGISAETKVVYTVYPAFDESKTDFDFFLPTVTIKVGEAFDYKINGNFVVNGADVTGEADFLVECGYDAADDFKCMAGIYKVVVSYKGLKAEMQLKVVNDIVDGDGDNVTDKEA